MKKSHLLVCVLAISSGTAHARQVHVTAPQGGVARWPGQDAKTCGMYARRYAAVRGVCYYPIDMRARVGRHRIALWDAHGVEHTGVVQVEATTFPDVKMDLPPSLARYIDVSPEDTARAAKESTEVGKLLKGLDEPPHFTLPLGKPAVKLPKSQDDFGSTRTFNGKKKSLHTGRDYPVEVNDALHAIADGTVVLATEQFYTGNAVYIDHGDGLVSESFHLKSLAVKTGDVVKRGQLLGRVGATGRATGPHLHLGVRWLGKRIDPALLLEAPTNLPSVTDSPAAAEEKRVEEAEKKEPPETDAPLAEDD